MKSKIVTKALKYTIITLCNSIFDSYRTRLASKSSDSRKARVVGKCRTSQNLEKVEIRCAALHVSFLRRCRAN